LELALSGFAIGLLLGAAKVLLIGTLGFGIAWWRTRRRLRALEIEHAQPSLTDERLQRLEQGFDYLASQLDRLVAGQAELARRLSPGEAPRVSPPSGPAARGSLQPEPAEPITPR
jgi:hypothetical protein